MDALHAQGKRVLLLLPHHYIQDEIPNHTSSSEEWTRVEPSDRALLDAWRSEGKLFVCASGLYDDWYWMFASVSSSQHGGGDDDSSPGPIVVTNDAMRDHWSELLPRRDFVRWRTSQIVPFSLEFSEAAAERAVDAPSRGTTIDGEACSAATEDVPAPCVRVAQLPPYSSEPQRLGARWHIPIPDDADEEGRVARCWLCCDAAPRRRSCT